jgi:hypothetical protein
MVVVFWLTFCLMLLLSRASLGSAMYNLAGMQSSNGRHQEAAEIMEKTLQFRLRVLPEYHPDIGAT